MDSNECLGDNAIKTFESQVMEGRGANARIARLVDIPIERVTAHRASLGASANRNLSGRRRRPSLTQRAVSPAPYSKPLPKSSTDSPPLGPVPLSGGFK